MQSIKDYWTGKDKRAKKAQLHTEEVATLYKTEIENSIKNTVKYDEEHIFPKVCPSFDPARNDPSKRTKISVIDTDSVSAVLNETNNNIAVLNFASYKHPGGGFIVGSSAQEESLCHESFLYNVLVNFTETYYKENEKEKNKALYLNRALYSPGIIFERDGKKKACGVLTCAAPNLTTAKKYCHVSDKENTEVLSSRIEFVLDVLAEQHKDTIVLGAFGCGVFGQNPTEVALCFKDYLETKFKNRFRKVIFAIPKASNGNLNAFKKAFKTIDLQQTKN